ncbi:aquaporin-like protein [Lophium mytilinum]|uniref:Aquaporin-like protein n=1 Tax=Lophium mytilinum TaxID=390894 RepID=A0A6A6REK6_9PEZI|nr:aquaporin-like protein [Lophium mytilinum]
MSTSRKHVHSLESTGAPEATRDVEQQGLHNTVSRPFAGRIGGNQQFTVSRDDSQFESITRKAPDAATYFSWHASIDPRGFSDLELWKEATIEGVGTGLQIFLSGLFSLGLSSAITETSLGPLLPATIGAIANTVLISLFIFAGGPVSGGHFNPFITIATFFARLATLPRTTLYVAFQCSGAVIGGFLMRAALGLPAAALEKIPGCYVDTSLVNAGQAYTFEFMTAFALIFVAFGVGLDPRQRVVFGPALSPILVGIALGLCTFSTGFVTPGFSGASLNPARCLGLMAAAERFDYHYVHWLGDITAAILNGIMYWCIPIYKD